MLNDIFDWFMVMSNNKSFTLVVFVATFVAIIVYVYGSKKRSARFETYRNIPFLDDDDARVPYHEASKELNSNTAGEKK